MLRLFKQIITPLASSPLGTHFTIQQPGRDFADFPLKLLISLSCVTSECWFRRGVMEELQHCHTPRLCGCVCACVCMCVCVCLCLCMRVLEGPTRCQNLADGPLWRHFVPARNLTCNNKMYDGRQAVHVTAKACRCMMPDAFPGTVQQMAHLKNKSLPLPFHSVVGP